MHVDAAKLGFRLNVGNAYVVYILIVSIFSIPVAAISHKVFANIDSHASIVAAVIFTAVIFIWFNFF